MRKTFTERLQAINRETAASAGWKRWERFGQNALLLLALAGIVYYFAHNYVDREKGTDFTDRYAAARIVLEGYGHQLYDFHTQEQFQIRYSGRVGEYYIHPPFETLLFLPICLWSPQAGYLIWCLLNAGVLAYVAIMFQRHIFKRLDWRVSLPLFFLFPPVLISFLQGQDSLLLLLVMTQAVVELRRDRDFRAGCWLSFGLFKFNIVLTLIVLVGSIRKKGGVFEGAALGSVIWLLISIGVSGWTFLTTYPRFLMALSTRPTASIHPAGMANIRGLVSVLGIVQDATARLALIWIISIFVFWYAWKRFKGTGSKVDATSLAFGNFVLAALLVSYHLSTSDLCIALLPMGLFAQYLAEHDGIPRWARLTLLSSQYALFLPPLHVISLAVHVYVYPIIPILIMFFLTANDTFKGAPLSQPEFAEGAR